MLKTFLQHTSLVLWKKRLKKTANIGKMRAFWKCPKMKVSKGYRLCKIVTLGQKLKMHKNMLKTFLQQLSVVLWKTRLKKTANIGKMRAFWKCPKMPVSKGYRLCKIVTLGQRFKLHKKHAKNVSTTHCSCSMQKTAPKNS